MTNTIIAFMDDYQKVVNSLKRKKNGTTVADISADTALSLVTVRELLPKAADEYSGHLQVTESGEILYLFPAGFSSRYRGLGAKLKKIFGFLKTALKATLVFLFKVWIMVMLIGYFILFIVIALAGVFLSIAAQSKSSGNNRRGGSSGVDIFSLIWRIWFIQEITQPRYGRKPISKTKNNRPMHKAVFSFVFGEGDPDKNWEENEEKTIISYIQANKGVISLAEYMAFTGRDSVEAETSIISFCGRFGGSPEVTDEGTIVYRFDDLLLRAASKNFPELSPPVKRLKVFSLNTKKMNVWFILINAVNMIFGSYFLFNSINTGLLITELQYQGASYLYAYTHFFLDMVTANPHYFIGIFLGLVPLIFSVLFWVIPAVRRFMEKKENEEIKLSNFKKLGFSKIWFNPLNFQPKKIIPPSEECNPANIENAGDRVIKDLGAISEVDVEQGENGEYFYSFRELEKEKLAIEEYRKNIDPARSELGTTVFDTMKNA
jgi:hypothetical protein